MSDGVKQVRLAQPHAAIEEKGVVGLPRRLGYGLRGGVRELVATANDKGRKGVARIEARLTTALQRSSGPVLPLARGALLFTHLRVPIRRVFWAIHPHGY